MLFEIEAGGGANNRCFERLLKAGGGANNRCFERLLKGQSAGFWSGGNSPNNSLMRES